MPEDKPGVYIFHGEDERSIAQAISDLEARLGDPTTVALNKTVMEAKDFDLDALRGNASAMPFMADRRMIIVKNPLQKLNSPQLQKKFLTMLLELPLTTALLVVEYKRLEDKHWFMKWAEENKPRVFVRVFSNATQKDLEDWIHGQASRSGGRFTSLGAEALAGIVGNDTNFLYHEIQKLLAQVNYARPVDEEDVNLVTVGPMQANIFAMVDAISLQNSKQALGELQRLFEMEEPLQILGMIVRQFRLLIMTAEVLQSGGQQAEVMRRVGVPAFVAKKLIAQASRLDGEELEQVHRRLLELDYGIKMGQIEDQVGMDELVASFTTRSGKLSR